MSEFEFDEIPATWIGTTLGAVIDYGKTKKVEPKDIPHQAWVLELEDIAKDTSQILTRFTFEQRQSKSTKNRFEVGDVLYGKLRPYLNKVIIADKDGYSTTEVIPLKTNGYLDNRFLFRWLKHPQFLAYVEAQSHGMNMPRLGTEAGKAAPFILPPLPEQTRIANKLDTLLARVDSARERLDRVPEILKRFRQAVLTAATSGVLTEAWREDDGYQHSAKAETLEQIQKRRENCPPKKKFKEPIAPDLSYWNFDLPPTWSVESVSAFTECLDHLRIPVTKDQRSTAHGLYPYYGANGIVDRVDEYLFDDELVLVTEDKTFYGREKPIAYRVSGKCWVNNHAHVLLPGNKTRADFLSFSLMHYDVLPWLTGTTGRAKLTQGALNGLPIAVPPESEMREIVRQVQILFAYADRLESRLKAARKLSENLSPAILAKAFRGELVAQDPNDEPAIELLKRIRAGRK